MPLRVFGSEGCDDGDLQIAVGEPHRAAGAGLDGEFPASASGQTPRHRTRRAVPDRRCRSRGDGFWPCSSSRRRHSIIIRPMTPLPSPTRRPPGRHRRARRRWACGSVGFPAGAGVGDGVRGGDLAALRALRAVRSRRRRRHHGGAARLHAHRRPGVPGAARAHGDRAGARDAVRRARACLRSRRPACRRRHWLADMPSRRPLCRAMVAAQPRRSARGGAAARPARPRCGDRLDAARSAGSLRAARPC